jgi:hypothetical protein
MWDDANEKLLQNWGHKAQYYRILNEQAAALYKRRERWFGIPLIILGSVTTSTLFVSFGTQQDIYVNVVSAVLSMSFTLLTALGKFLNYSELTHIYSDSANKYDALVMDIQEQLSIPRLSRQDPSTFSSQVKTTMRQLKQTISVPSYVLQKYIDNVDRHFRQMGIDINTEGAGTFIDQEDIQLVVEHTQLHSQDVPKDKHDTTKDKHDTPKDKHEAPRDKPDEEKQDSPEDNTDPLEIAFHKSMGDRLRAFNMYYS